MCPPKRSQKERLVITRPSSVEGAFTACLKVRTPRRIRVNLLELLTQHVLDPSPVMDRFIAISKLEICLVPVKRVSLMVKHVLRLTLSILEIPHVTMARNVSIRSADRSDLRASLVT